MADDLDPDSQTLLAGLGLDQTPQVPSDDDEIVVPARPNEDTDPVVLGGTGGGSTHGSAPQGDYVPKAEFDSLRQELAAQRAQFDAIQQQLGQRAAQNFQPQHQPQYVPPSQYGQPAPQADMTQQLNDLYYQNPVGFTAQLVQAAIRQQGQPLIAAQQQTEVTVAQQIIGNLRGTYAQQDPELSKLALPEVDAIVAQTPPETLAQYLREGSLQKHYENAYLQAVGKKMRPVYATAASRKQAQRAVNEPPSIGGGSVTSIAGKRTSGEIRMSDLDEADREAVEQGRKLGLSADVVLRQSVS